MIREKYLDIYPLPGEMAYFTFRNIRSTLYDIIIEELPPITHPRSRVESFVVPGRSGSMNISDEAYDSYTKTVKCLLMTDIHIDNVASWLTGDGKAVFSNEPNRIYDVHVKNARTLSRAFMTGHKRFQIQFETQPYKSSANPEEPLELTAPTTLTNPGTLRAHPILTIHGTGNMTVSISGRSFSLTGITDYIVVDSRMVTAYRTNTQLMNHHMAGEFPYLDPGENRITWTGNISKIVIQPNWRWL